MLVAYTTWGSAYGTSGDTRESESLRALMTLGVAPGSVVLLGRQLEVADGYAAASSAKVLTRCREAFRDSAIERLITVAWEGGHPDHDITHLVAKRLATDWQVQDEFYEFPLYTAAGAPPPLFRVNRFSGDAGDTSHTRLGFRERVSAFMLARCYPSQWKSFVGLLPEAAVRYLIQGQQQLRRVAAGAQDDRGQPARPHDGPLFYERRFNLSFESLVAEAAPLLVAASHAT